MIEVVAGKRRTPQRARPARIVGICILVVIALAIAIPNVITNMEKRAVCRACGAWRETTSWGIGTDFNSGMYWNAETISPSTVLDEIYGGTHAHSWTGCGATTYFFGLKNGIVCGNPLSNPMTLVYERDEAFRDAVRRRLAAGSLKREELVTFLEIPDLRRCWEAPPGLDVKSPGFRDRLRRAYALVREIGIPSKHSFAFAGWEEALQ